MSLAPIVLFTYNRPWHTKQVLESLVLNKEASKSILYIYCDGSKENAKDHEIEKIKELRSVVREKKWCREVVIIERDKNFGLAESVITGVTEIVNKYGVVIVLEDDLLLSPYFLSYMNQALSIYQDKENVACISGYVYPLKKKLSQTFFVRGADCWSWATWKDQWSVFQEDGRVLLDEIESSSLRSLFDFNNSYDYYKMLENQIENKNDSWAIRWYASAFLKNKLCLYPSKTLVKNIGLDGSGTHTGSLRYFDDTIDNKEIILKPIEEKENPFARELFISFFKKTSSNSYKNTFLKKLKKKFKMKMKTFFQKKEFVWKGNFKNWSKAYKKCKGYNDITILNKTKEAILKVKNGEAIYERDTVLFDKIDYNEFILDIFNQIIKENNGVLNIVDFGGSLGSSYFQYKSLLNNAKKVHWNIIEQEHYVTLGKKEIEDNNLKFYYNLEEAVREQNSKVLFLSSVLQYIESPFDLLLQAFEMNFEYLIIDRTAFIEDKDDRITIQHVPESIYKASYPSWFFNEEKLINFFKDKYFMQSNFNCEITQPTVLEDKIGVYWKGFILKRKRLDE